MKTRILQDAISGSYTLTIDGLTMRDLRSIVDAADQGAALRPDGHVLGIIVDNIHQQLRELF